MMLFGCQAIAFAAAFYGMLRFDEMSGIDLPKLPVFAGCASSIIVTLILSSHARQFYARRFTGRSPQSDFR